MLDILLCRYFEEMIIFYGFSDKTIYLEPVVSRKILLNTLLVDIVKPLGDIIKISKPHCYQSVP